MPVACQWNPIIQKDGKETISEVPCLKLRKQCYKIQDFEFNEQYYSPCKNSVHSVRVPDISIFGMSNLDILRFFRSQGPVSRKSRELLRPKKTFVKLRPAYSVKLVF